MESCGTGLLGMAKALTSRQIADICYSKKGAVAGPRATRTNAVSVSLFVGMWSSTSCSTTSTPSLRAWDRGVVAAIGRLNCTRVKVEEWILPLVAKSRGIVTTSYTEPPRQSALLGVLETRRMDGSMRQRKDGLHSAVSIIWRRRHWLICVQRTRPDISIRPDHPREMVQVLPGGSIEDRKASEISSAPSSLELEREV